MGVLYGFQDVVFLSSRANFSTFPKNVVEVKAYGLPHVPKLWLDKQGHTHRKIFLLKQTNFFVPVELHGEHRTVTKMR